MPKVFNEIDLIKSLLEKNDTLAGMIHYKGVSMKKDGILVLFQMKVDLNMKDIFLKIQNKPIPFIVLTPKDIVEKTIKEIEFKKEENVNAKLQG